MSVRDAYNKTWDVNVTGTHIMTTSFIPLLFASSSPRIIFITSGTSSLVETELPDYSRNISPPAGWPKDHTGIMNITLYRSSKTGMNMMFREWVRLLRNDGRFKVFCIAPGFLATNLNGMTPEQLKNIGAVDPAPEGYFIKDVVEGKRDADAGKIMRKNGIQPW
jgi:NAD(P)-dependent dehydrogenase (short-subunit alcohol dehydrogenase family)